MNIRNWSLAGFVVLGILGTGAAAVALDPTDEAMIREIQSLDAQTRQQLAADMIGGLQQSAPAGHERQVSALANAPEPAVAAHGHAADSGEVRFQVPELNQPVKEWQFQIRDDKGRMVKTYSGFNAPPRSLQWNRQDETGRTVIANNKFNYILKTSSAATGSSSQETVSIRLDPEPEIKPVPEPVPQPRTRLSRPAPWTPVPASAVVAASGYVEPAAIEPVSVKISRQPDGHILITTGDRVYFPTPVDRPIQPRENYLIYKRVDPRGGPAAWYEQVGRLRVLAVQGQLSIGLIVAARDIISEGDAILLDHP